MTKKNVFLKAVGILKALVPLAIVMAFAACEHNGSLGGSGGDSVVYRSTVDGKEMVLTIEKPKGNANILASAYGSPVYAAYVPQNGDIYTIRLAGVLVSSGTVTVNTSSAKMTFRVDGTGATFEASITSTGGALTFTAGIKTIEGVPEITIRIEVETTTPPFVETPITPPTTNPPTTNPPTYPPVVYPPVVYPTPADSGVVNADGSITLSNPQQVYDENGSLANNLNGTFKDPGAGWPENLDMGGVTNGKLTFALPSTAVTAALLTALEENGMELEPDIELDGTIGTPSGAKVYGMEISLHRGSDTIGRVSLRNTTGAYQEVQYWYANQDCQINASFPEENPNSDYYGATSTISVTAKRGWNKVYGWFTGAGSTATGTFTSDSSALPSGMLNNLKWVFRESHDDNDNDEQSNTIEVADQRVSNGNGTNPYTGSDGTVKLGGLEFGGAVTDGILEFTLPATVDDEHLVSVNQMATAVADALDSTVSNISDSTVKAQVWDHLSLYNSSELLGHITLVKHDEGEGEGAEISTDHEVKLMYFDNDVTITIGSGNTPMVIQSGRGWLLFSYTTGINLPGDWSSLRWAFNYQSNNGGDNRFQVTGQQVFDGNAGTQYAGGGTVKLGDVDIAGTVTGGQLSFAFPATVADNDLVDVSAMATKVADALGTTVGTISGNATKAQMWDYLSLYDNGTEIGHITLVKHDVDTDTDHEVKFMYFDNDVTITLGSGNTPMVLQSDKGWLLFSYTTGISFSGDWNNMRWAFNYQSNNGGDDEPQPNTIAVSNEQVYQTDETANYTGAGTVKLGALEIGSVDEGKLTFTLPATVANSYLGTVTAVADKLKTLGGWTSYQITEGGDASAQMWEHLELYNDTTKLGTISLGKTVESAFLKINFMYFDRHVSITGTYSDDGRDPTQLVAGTGWFFGGRECGYSTNHFSNLEVASSMKWVFTATAASN
jgi:hypothetical protein